MRAENTYGVGEPLDTENSIVAKPPFDVPSAPGMPEPLHTADEAITVGWTRPLSDGKSPITGYVLERRLADGSGGPWERATFGTIVDTRFRATGLVAQRSYSFRVAAVNAAGQGAWSEPSAAIVAANAPSRPSINMGMLARDLTVLAGQPANLLVPYAAAPRPTVEWSRNGVPVSEQRATIESSDFMTQLTYKRSERGDAGTYSLRLENDHGSDSIDIRLRVVAPPSPPQDLKADDIAPDSCRLNWRCVKKRDFRN